MESIESFKHKTQQVIERVSLDHLLVVSICVLYLGLLVISNQLSLFSLVTVLVFHLFLASIVLLVVSKVSQVHKTGVINHLPKIIQSFFLEVSVFDVLCHLWYVPNISLYIHRIFLPFVVQMSREEAYSMFNDLNPNVAKLMDTKGVINILPDPLVRIIMPKKFSIEQHKPSVDINVLSFNENQARVIRPKTVLISSGSRSSSSNRLGQGINDITRKIPTLEPIFSKILGHHFRQLMAKISPKVLGLVSLIAGGGIMLQVLMSKHARAWLATGFKFSCLTSSLALLVVSFLGLVIKMIHNQIEEPKNESPIEGPKIFRATKRIKSRFNSKADKNYFFNPDLKMAS